MTENVQEACIFLAGVMGSMIILTFGCMWKDKQIQTTGSLGGGKRQHLQRRLVKQRAVYLKLIVLDNHIQISETPFTPRNKQMLMQSENVSGLKCD